jgi:probable HAF family extracellular repeat protein
MNTKAVYCLALTLIAFGLAAIAQAAPVYQLSDLGTLGGTESGVAAGGINVSGQVVGGAQTSNFPPYHAFLYSGGVMQDLGAGLVAHGINDSGQVVGGGLGGTRGEAFLYSGGAFMSLGDLAFGEYGGGSVAYGINNSGQVVGDSPALHFFPETHAFLYSGGVMHDLTPSGGDSYASAINAAGQVVGTWGPRGLPGSHAFLYSDGVMQDLGTLGGSSSAATGINASGQIVGRSYATGDATQIAFLYSGGTMTNLGTFPGWLSNAATGINDSGQVVGAYYRIGDSDLHPFLYSGGTMYDLNTLLDRSGAGWTLADQPVINDNGWIAVNGIFGGYQHAVLLTPVPEPSSLTLGLLVLVTLSLFPRTPKTGTIMTGLRDLQGTAFRA